MFIDCSEEYTLSNFGGLEVLQIKSQFYNKGEQYTKWIFENTNNYQSI